MSEPIIGANEEPTKNTNSNTTDTDFMKVSGGILSNINYKVALFLFVVSMIIFSDVFIEFAIRPFGDTVSDECTTTKGTMLQLIFMVVSYVFLDLVVKYEIL